jgi:hypothetical protein
MKINPQKLRETTRNLSFMKITADCDLYKQKGNVNS